MVAANDSASLIPSPPVPGASVTPPPLYIGALKVDPPILQAPMAGFTNYVYRKIVREFGGAGLLNTEMISAEGFVRQVGGVKGSYDRLWGVKDEPRPLSVQMWDNCENTLADVGRKLTAEFGVSVIDLNFGCPVRKVTAAHSGSYLLTDPARVGKIVEAVVRACAPTPVTAKIRLGCTRNCITAHEIARVVEESGAAALTVHGRVAEDFFSGNADWDQIASIKSRLKHIPLIGNGDLDSPRKVVEAFRRYGVDGVMIARAGLSRPWLFSQCAAALRGEDIPLDPSMDEQKRLILRHHREVVARFGENRGNILFRKYSCTYAQGKPGASEFRSHASKCSTSEDFVRIIESFFPRSDLGWTPMSGYPGKG